MSRTIMANADMDFLRKALGKFKEILPTDGGGTTLRYADYGKINATILGNSGITESGVSGQKTTIRLDLIESRNNFEEVLLEGIRTGIDYYDHFVSVPKLREPSGDTRTQNSFVPLYKCETEFNYYSQNYEDAVVLRNERSIPPSYSYVDKERFMNDPGTLLVESLGYFKNAVIKEDAFGNSIENLKNYPYYNKFLMTLHTNNQFLNFIKDIDLFDDVLGGYTLSQKTNINFNIQDGTESVQVGVPIGAFDLFAWASSPEIFPIENQYRAFNQETVYDSKMLKQFKKSLLAGYIRRMANGGMRTYSQILEGVSCHRDDFVYSIEKWKQALAGESMQNFYIPADRDTVEFVDTQIKYGERYIYNCASHCIIVGNRYRYENFQLIGEGSNQSSALLDVHNFPSIIMIPVSMFQKTTTMLQPPPMVPQVNFVTKNDSSKQVDIYLSSTGGSEEGSFEPIWPSDEDQARDLVGIYGENPVTFKDFDHSAMFEIYRSKEPPESYLDFRKHSDIRMPQVSPDALFKDYVEPNQKVYYMFRKVNIRGLVSNPSPIYEVELLIDADDSKLIIETYQFPEEITKQNTKKFKNLFQIKPAIEHVIFEENQPFLINKESLRGTVDNVSIGTSAEKSLWGRKLKFRIKSTMSGKIIDYNITFRLTKNKTEQDF